MDRPPIEEWTRGRKVIIASGDVVRLPAFDRALAWIAELEAAIIGIEPHTFVPDPETSTQAIDAIRTIAAQIKEGSSEKET